MKGLDRWGGGRLAYMPFEGRMRAASYLALAVLLRAAVAQAQFGGAPLTNLRIPLEHYADGTVRLQVQAGTAQMQEDGNIHAETVRIEMFAADGSLQGVVEAADCLVDRDSEFVTSSSPVNYSQEGLSISGVGFEWRASDQFFRILNQARVVFAREVVDPAVFQR